jgi:hypothetical protein
MATSLDAGGPPTLRRRPSIKILASRPNSAGTTPPPANNGVDVPAETNLAEVGPALIHQLLTPRGEEASLSNTSSPKGPFSK